MEIVFGSILILADFVLIVLTHFFLCKLLQLQLRFYSLRLPFPGCGLSDCLQMSFRSRMSLFSSALHNFFRCRKGSIYPLTFGKIGYGICIHTLTGAVFIKNRIILYKFRFCCRICLYWKYRNNHCQRTQYSNQFLLCKRIISPPYLVHSLLKNNVLLSYISTPSVLSQLFRQRVFLRFF